MQLFVVLAALLMLHGQSEAIYFGNYECGTYSHNGQTTQRDTVVHLFEWTWEDIESECSRFLGPRGYCAVQVSPANEHALITNAPWWQRYQPVSYIINSRSGDENKFKSMLSTCNNNGVRIYVDAVINHMTGGGSGTGSAGSSWSGDDLNYPGVPYSYLDFNGASECSTGSGNIENYNDANQVRNCRLVGLRDLKMGASYVRGKLRDFLNHLISMGVAGFRIDAAKHMWPGDLSSIYDSLNNLRSDWFGSGKRPYIYQEVIDHGGEAVSASEYVGMGRVTEFKYGLELSNVFRKYNGQLLRYLANFGESWGFMNAVRAVVFIDNHDNQRGHGGGGSVLTFQDSQLYKMATAFKLAWSYGHVRIMSSYSFSDTDAGPPSSPVPINGDDSCGGGWICEHRWRQIYNMVGFHNTVLGTSVVNWWDNGAHAIAFGRGKKGFIVINNEDYTISETLYTGLSAGTYCDVISGLKSGSSCTGTSITVDSGGNAYFNIPRSTSNYDSMVAIHVNEKL